nr:glycosyl hydrolase family 28 protein [Mucilaginibacter sp. L294]
MNLKGYRHRICLRQIFVRKNVLSILLPAVMILGFISAINGQALTIGLKDNSIIDAADFGFSPSETGINNTLSLQKAIDHGGTIIVRKPGTYKIAGTVYIGDNKTIKFSNGVIIQKSAEHGGFSQIFLNKGAITKTYNHDITIQGLTIKVNNVEIWMDKIYGLRGQVSFFYVKNLIIKNFRCDDVGQAQFCLQVCTFQDLLIDSVFIKGKKDGIHLGKGSRFKISNATFETGDDAIALAAGDWVTGNPEFGDIEDGIIENCYDNKADIIEGAFAKLVASAWVSWKPGLNLRHGDAVVSNGKIYRVLADIDGRSYRSTTRPMFESGKMELDGIQWLMTQKDTLHTAVVRRVLFKNILLKSARVPFQLLCYDNNFSHSYYSGAQVPVITEIMLDKVSFWDNNNKPLAVISSPCNKFTIKNSVINNSGIRFTSVKDLHSYPPTSLNFINCTFSSEAKTILVTNSCPQKKIFLKTTGSKINSNKFSANLSPGQGTIEVNSDLPGLKK